MHTYLAMGTGRAPSWPGAPQQRARANFTCIMRSHAMPTCIMPTMLTRVMLTGFMLVGML